MSTPRVSVLIPVWSAEATLAEALDDVLAQTIDDWECVLVLDGASDRSPDIAHAYAARDARIRVSERPHAGIVAALNAGLDACRAPYVARFDADDRMHPARLARQCDWLDAHPEVTLVTCRVAFGVIGDLSFDVTKSGMARHAAWLDSLDSPAKLRAARFIDAPVAHPAVMFRRAAIAAAGGYRQGPFAEDHDLWLRLFARAAIFDTVPELLVTWRDRVARLTRTDPRYADAERRALVHTHLVDALAGRHVRIWGAGEYGRRHAKELARRGVVIDDIIDIDPKKVGRRVAHGVPVSAADALGPPDGRVILVCVAAAGARALIAAELTGRGYREDIDWLALQ